MGSPTGLPAAPFAEALRRAHCAHPNAVDPEHPCIGRCTISRAGVELDCKACGSLSAPLAPLEHEARAARAVIEAVGMTWAALTPEAQRAAVAACERERWEIGRGR